MSSQRERLPNRRAHDLVNFQHAGFRYIAGIGRYGDGRLAELFIDASKAGTAVDVAARDAGRLAVWSYVHCAACA